jgi:hypothetical protein
MLIQALDLPKPNQAALLLISPTLRVEQGDEGFLSLGWDDKSKRKANFATSKN